MKDRYTKAYARGRPHHVEYDAFWLQHPFMPSGHKAKIFAPFDALKGYDECIASKEVLYEPMREPSQDIDLRLNILCSLTPNSKIARINRPAVSVTYYVPCSDPNSSAFGFMGQYCTRNGICLRVNLDSILIDDQLIPISSIYSIDGTVFKECDAS